MCGVPYQKQASAARLPLPPSPDNASWRGSAVEVLVGDESVHCPRTDRAHLDVQARATRAERMPNKRPCQLHRKSLITTRRKKPKEKGGGRYLRDTVVVDVVVVAVVVGHRTGSNNLGVQKYLLGKTKTA